MLVTDVLAAVGIALSVAHDLVRGRTRSLRSERGQTTAEYALVIVGAAAVAGLLIAWASQTHAVSKLFDVVVGHITKQ